MAAEVIRCSDCGTVFKAVPAWLGTAKVNFTCTNCPRRPSRAGARFEPAIEPRVKDDPDPEVVRMPDLDDDDEIEITDEDMEMADDDKEV